MATDHINKPTRGHDVAHEIEVTADEQASFAYSSQIGSAWHKLGVALPGLSNVDEILAACRGDYEVTKHRVVVEDPDVNGRLMPTDAWYTMRTSPTWFDSKAGEFKGGDNEVLGVVGGDYRVIQNRTVVELGLALADMTPDQPGVDCAGVLQNGRRFFVTIPLPPLVIDPKGINDVHGRNLVATTGHDGRHSLQVVNSITRAVCANTVAWALRGSTQQVKIRHTGRVGDSVASVKSKLGLLLSADEEFQLIAEQLLGQEASWSLVERIHDRLWPLKPRASQRSNTLRDRRLSTLEELWVSDRNSGGVGPNRWAALNTFTEYFEHQARIKGKDTTSARAERAVTSDRFAERVRSLTLALMQDSTSEVLANVS